MEKFDFRIKLKLVVHKKSETVLFAESSKDFVDFLLSLLSLPLGTILNLLKDGGMDGSISNLFRSVKSLDHTYIQSSKNLDSILNPKPSAIAFRNPLLLPNYEPMDRAVYTCLCSHGYSPYSRSGYRYYVSHSPDTACPRCTKAMGHRLQVVDSEEAAGNIGFVKGAVTYMISDNLEVKPLSGISYIDLIKSFHIKDVSSLEERVVDVRPAQALKLMQASLQSKNVLTSVFLNKAVPPPI